MNRPRLLFVYNADSGLFNTLADIGHKIFSPQTYECQLCALTHGYFSERQAWRTFVESLPADCEFLHRDEYRRRFNDREQPLPAIFRLIDGLPMACMNKADLTSCQDLAELQQLIRRNCLED